MGLSELSNSAAERVSDQVRITAVHGVVSGSAEPDLVGVMWWASSRTSISLTHGSIDLAIPCNFLAVIAAVRRRDPERQPREGRLRAGSTVACTTPSRPL